MNPKNSKGLDLVPKERPPTELIPTSELTPDPDLSLRPRINEEHLRALRWTMALAAVFRSQGLWRDIPGYRFAAYGFADPDFERDAFGVIVYAFPIEDVIDEEKTLRIGNYEFPIIVRRWTEVRQAAPPVHPTNGTSACWARSSKTRLSSRIGFLTAKHVVPRRGLVQTTHGPGRLLDLGPDGIDAALVAPPSSVAPNPGPLLGTVTRVAPWIDVTLVKQSGSVSTTVTHVTDTRGTLDPSIPARVFLAESGKPGDSGALVTDDSGLGIGLYVGELSDGAGRGEGFCQHLGQAAYAMNLTLYR